MMSTRSNYLNYLDARISARRSALIASDVFESMLSYTDVSLVIKHLLSSPYEHDMAEALIHRQGSDAVEAGIGLHMENLFKELHDFANYLPGQHKDLVYFLHRWDLIAIKTLLRRAACGKAAALIDLCTGPSLPWPLVQQLAETSNVEELGLRLQHLFPTLCHSFRGILKAGADTPQALLESLEIALDRDYFGRFAGIVPRNNTQKVIQQYLSIEIDRINIRAVLNEVNRHSRSSEPFQWLPGGLLSQKTLDAMLSSGSIESALFLLEATPYRSIHQVFYQIIQQGRFSGLDRKFETIMIDKLQNLIVRYPFSGALFMHYFWRKWVEGANLRILARGIEAHLPVGRIREELVYV